MADVVVKRLSAKQTLNRSTQNAKRLRRAASIRRTEREEQVQQIRAATLEEQARAALAAAAEAANRKNILDHTVYEESINEELESEIIDSIVNGILQVGQSLEAPAAPAPAAPVVLTKKDYDLANNLLSLKRVSDTFKKYETRLSKRLVAAAEGAAGAAALAPGEAAERAKSDIKAKIKSKLVGKIGAGEDKAAKADKYITETIDKTSETAEEINGKIEKDKISPDVVQKVNDAITFIKDGDKNLPSGYDTLLNRLKYNNQPDKHTYESERELLMIADTIHDFGETNKRGATKEALECCDDKIKTLLGAIGKSDIIDKAVIKYHPGTENPVKKVTKGNIESSTEEYFETYYPKSCNIPGNKKIISVFNTSVIKRSDILQKCKDSIVSIEFDDYVSSSVKDLKQKKYYEDYKKVGNQLLTYFFGANKGSEVVFFTFDSAKRLVRDIIMGLNEVGANYAVGEFITPQTMVDSAGTSYKLFNTPQIKQPDSLLSDNIFKNFTAKVNGTENRTQIFFDLFTASSNYFTKSDSVDFRFSINQEAPNKFTYDVTIPGFEPITLTQNKNFGPNITYLKGYISNPTNAYRTDSDAPVVVNVKNDEDEDDGEDEGEGKCMSIKPIMEKYVVEPITEANKLMINKLCFDIKRMGDHEQANALYHHMRSNYNTKCVFVTGDKLCALYSRLIGNPTIYVLKRKIICYKGEPIIENIHELNKNKLRNLIEETNRIIIVYNSIIDSFLKEDSVINKLIENIKDNYKRYSHDNKLCEILVKIQAVSCLYYLLKITKEFTVKPDGANAEGEDEDEDEGDELLNKLDKIDKDIQDIVASVRPFQDNIYNKYMILNIDAIDVMSELDVINNISEVQRYFDSITEKYKKVEMYISFLQNNKIVQIGGPINSPKINVLSDYIFFLKDGNIDVTNNNTINFSLENISTIINNSARITRHSSGNIINAFRDYFYSLLYIEDKQISEDAEFTGDNIDAKIKDILYAKPIPGALVDPNVIPQISIENMKSELDVFFTKIKDETEPPAAPPPPAAEMEEEEEDEEDENEGEAKMEEEEQNGGKVKAVYSLSSHRIKKISPQFPQDKSPFVNQRNDTHLDSPQAPSTKTSASSETSQKISELSPTSSLYALREVLFGAYNIYIDLSKNEKYKKYFEFGYKTTQNTMTLDSYIENYDEGEDEDEDENEEEGEEKEEEKEEEVKNKNAPKNNLSGGSKSKKSIKHKKSSNIRHITNRLKRAQINRTSKNKRFNKSRRVGSK